MKIEKSKQMDLGRDPVPHIIIRYAIPSIIAFLGMSMGTVVDGLVVGNFIGTDAIAAVNLVFPLAIISMGLSMMIAAGGSTLTAAVMGAGRPEKANRIFSLTVSVILIISVLLAVVLYIFNEPLFSLLQVKGSVLDLVKSYAIPLLPFFPFFMLSIVLEGFVRIDGEPVFAMKCMIAGVIVNMIVSVSFVAFLGLGVSGTALATGIGQIVSLAGLSTHFIKKRGSLKISAFIWNPLTLLRILGNGSSELANNIAKGFSTLIFNYAIITTIGVSGVAVFSIVDYIMMFAFIFSIGFASAVSPGISYNYGAGNVKRIREFMQTTLNYIIISAVVLVGILFFATEFLASFFSQGDRELQLWAARIARIYSPAVLFGGMHILISVYFTAIQQAARSAAIAVAGSVVFKSFFVLLLPRFIGETGIWISIPLGDFCTLVFGFILYKTHSLSQERSVPLARIKNDDVIYSKIED